MRSVAAMVLVWLAPPARADVVLHPGTVNGTIGLGDATITGGNVYLASPAGFEGWTDVTGSTFSLTLEGDQTYDTISAYAQLGASRFRLNTTSPAGIFVPAGGTVAVDLSRPRATIAVAIDVAGGALLTSRLFANASGPGFRYETETPGGSNVSIPVVDGLATAIQGTASVQVHDALGAVACVATIPLPTTTVTPAGGAASATLSAAVSLATCASTISGTVRLDGLDPAIAMYTDLYHYSAVTRAWTHQAFTGNGVSYELSGLVPGDQHVHASLYLARPGWGERFTLPYNGGEYWFPLAAGEHRIEDFVFDAVPVSGSLTASGPGAAEGSPAHYAEFDGRSAPSAGGFAYAYPGASSSSFDVVLTPGLWSESVTLRFEGSTPQPWSAAARIHGVQDVELAAGAPAVVAPVDVPVTAGRIVFDVVEPPGTGVVGLSSPSYNAYRTDADGRYHQLYGGSSVQNADTAQVRAVGPPGSYRLSAWAIVRGSQATFATDGTLELGLAVNTPAGSDVAITPTDAGGTPLPLTLRFENVTGAGETTVTTTSVGPAPPPNFRIVPATGVPPYLDVATTAQLTGSIAVAIQYDPDALALTPEQERALRIAQWLCTPGGSCGWVFPPSQGPDTAANVVVAEVDSLSLFALMVAEQIPPAGSCVGAPGAPVTILTDPGVCGATVDNANGVAGSCADAGGGLASCTFDGAASATLGPGEHAVVVEGAALDGSTTTCTSYVVVIDREPPAVACQAPVTVECAGETTAVSLAATCADACGACDVTCDPGPFHLGVTSVGCQAADAGGNGAGCTTAVEVVDTSAPRITVAATPQSLWPPNHKLVAIQLAVASGDACDPAPEVGCDVTSSEPEDARGDGTTAPDVVWKDGELFLRAERSGVNGEGRTYTIRCTARDAAGNAAPGEARVFVPFDRSGW